MDRSSAWRVALGLTPLLVLLIGAVGFPSSVDDIGAIPPSVVGLPLGVLMVLAGLAWMAIGVVVLWRIRTPNATLLTLAFFTVPSMALVVTTPALLLLLQASAS